MTMFETSLKKRFSRLFSSSPTTGADKKGPNTTQDGLPSVTSQPAAAGTPNSLEQSTGLPIPRQQASASEVPVPSPTSARPRTIGPQDTLFNSLAGGIDQASLGTDGTVALLKALQVSETDVTMLVFLYMCNAASVLDIQREEFVRGVQALGASDMKTLRKNLFDKVEETFKGEKEFVTFYKYVFQACREGTIKSIPKESASYLIPICFSRLPAEKQRYVTPFCAFLEGSSDIKHIKADEWASFYTFACQVKSISTYDSSGHWPLMYDSFAEWVTANPDGNKG